eukprot:scaffold8877_cov112-Isochrysis_galbana.AAC.17
MFDVLGEAEIPRGATFCPQHGCSVKECVKQASVTSFDAMQPSGCRGVQAGRQAEAGCSCALRWHLRPPGFAHSRGGAARHLKQSVCCGVDGIVKIKVCRPNGPA